MRHERFGRDQTLPSGEQDQQAGTVSSFTPGSTPGTGTLTIMVGNSSVTGQVTNDTRLECESSAPDTQGDEGNDDGDNGQNSGDDNSGSGDNQTVNSQDGDNGSDNSGDNDGAGEDQGDDEQMCSTSSLTPGTSVSEANLEITSAGAIWQKVELITS
jgi:hypothetical protein